jgi:hypothetical protein
VPRAAQERPPALAVRELPYREVARRFVG